MSLEIKNFACVEINREKGPSITQNYGLPESFEKDLLIKALPYGKPLDQTLKVISLDEQVYLSYLRLSGKEDKGVALILHLSEELYKYNPVGYLPSLDKVTAELLKNGSIDKKTLVLEYKEPKIDFKEIEDLDTIVFSILTKQHVALVGSKDDALNFIASVWACSPNELKHHLSFTVQVNSLSENSVILSLPLIDENIRNLEANKDKFNFLVFEMNKAFGKYSAPSCVKIAQLYKKGKIEEIKAIITQLYNLCVLKDTLETPADFAETVGITLGDAMLVQWMRANHFNLKMEESFLEFLDHVG